MCKWKNYKFSALLILLSSLLIPVKAAEVSTYIVGGEDAEREYPWMVALYYNGYFTCGGVLVSNNWVMTAAHCVYEADDNSGNATAYDAANFSVVIGESTHYSFTSSATSAGVDVYDISEVVIHTGYDNDSYDNDIALLRLDTAVIEPGPALATVSRFNQIDEGDPLTTIGYGMMSGDENASAEETIPTTLQEADLPYILTSDCFWESNAGTDVTDNMFCAGYESTSINIDSCSGDSGGPIFTTLDGELTLVGLVSWGSSACADYPGVYTNISNLTSWIYTYLDGYQVVEQGTASYDNGSFESGLITVYHYGDETSDPISIGNLSFDDSDYSSVFSVDESCVNSDVYATDSSCPISFDLNAAISADEVYTAQLTVNDVDYALRFETELISADSDDSSSDSDDDTDSDSSNSLSSSSGGALHHFALLFIVVALYSRRKQLLVKY